MRLRFCQLKHSQCLYTGVSHISNRPVLQFHHIIRTIATTSPNPVAADQAEDETPFAERLKRRIWGANLPDALKPKANIQTTPPEKDEATPAVKAHHTDPTSADGYVPRHDGRDLTVVGFVGKLGVQKAGVKPIKSFPLQDRITDPEVLKVLLRRAVLETYTIILHGRDAAVGVSRDTMPVEDFTKDVDVILSPDGGFQFIYKSNEVLTEILGQSPEVTVGEIVETVQTDQGMEKTQGTGGGIQRVEESHGIVKEGATEFQKVEEGQGAAGADLAVKALGDREATKETQRAAKAQGTGRVQGESEVQGVGRGQEVANVQGTLVAEKAHQGVVTEVHVQEPTEAQGPQKTPENEKAHRVKSQAAGEVQIAQTTTLPVQTNNTRRNTLAASTPDEAWLSLPLPPTHIFAIHKRILATTGQRLHDHALSHSPTASALLDELLAVAAPPSDKLDLLQAAPELAQLSNVKVLKTRIRPVDKDTEIGMLSPGVKEWLEMKRREAAGEEIDGQFVYKWDEGKYFVAK